MTFRGGVTAKHNLYLFMVWTLYFTALVHWGTWNSGRSHRDSMHAYISAHMKTFLQFMHYIPNVDIDWLATLLPILEISGWNVDSDIKNPDRGFSWISSDPPDKYQDSTSVQAIISFRIHYTIWSYMFVVWVTRMSLTTTQTNNLKNNIYATEESWYSVRHIYGNVSKKCITKLYNNLFINFASIGKFTQKVQFKKEKSYIFLLGRPRRRWVDNIKLDLIKIGWDGMDWIDMVQDRDQWRALVNKVLNLRVP
jgi:hypothetical protein